jgi:hypothetical protein
MACIVDIVRMPELFVRLCSPPQFLDLSQRTRQVSAWLARHWATSQKRKVVFLEIRPNAFLTNSIVLRQFFDSLQARAD